jgi:hypothetical protein
MTMAKDVELTINPAKPSTIDFEVKVSGVEGDIAPRVRFVLDNIIKGVMLSVDCANTSDDGHQWSAKFPPLSEFKPSDCEFRVEVIIDDYLFTPAFGSIKFINAPAVTFESNKPKTKPTVTTSFTVTQPDDVKEDIAEIVTIPPIMETSPTVLPLLNIDDDIVATALAEVETSHLESPFKLSKGVQSSGTGSLFARDNEGKILVPGLLTAKQEKFVQDTNSKVSGLVR